MIGRCLIGLIGVYRAVLSPLFGNCCRFYPSCSAYAVEAIEKHGCARGCWLSLRRICKCHPFHPGGPDLVPQPRDAARKRNREIYE